MRVLTITELMRLTRTELRALLTRITNELPAFPEGSAERTNAHVKIGNIRRLLARLGLPEVIRAYAGRRPPAARNHGRAGCLLTA